MQAAGNHQMEHQPQVAIQANRDSLADPAQFAHGSTLCIRDGRHYGADKKRACEPNPLDRLAHDSCIESGDVGGDIRQFRHVMSLQAVPALLQIVIRVPGQTKVRNRSMSPGCRAGRLLMKLYDS
jgi:hypothetical protein